MDTIMYFSVLDGRHTTLNYSGSPGMVRSENAGPLRPEQKAAIDWQCRAVQRKSQAAQLVLRPRGHPAEGAVNGEP